MSKIIKRVDFDSKFQCLRCGILDEEKVCKMCKDLQKCKICSILLRHAFRFYKYNLNSDGDYNEISYVIVSPYPPFKPNMCYGCIGWELGMKYWCYVCGKWFDNTLENYKVNGNCCPKHENENENSISPG